MDCYVSESSKKLTKMLMWEYQLIMKMLKKGSCHVILRAYCLPGQHKVQVGKRMYRYIEHTSSPDSVTDVYQPIHIVLLCQPNRLKSPCIQAVCPERKHLLVFSNRKIREQAINHIFGHSIQCLKYATCFSLYHKAIIKLQYQKYKKEKLLMYIHKHYQLKSIEF